MTATVVAHALAAGVMAAGGRADVCPIADGGEGTLDVLSTLMSGSMVTLEASAPDGRSTPAKFLLVDGDATAVVETATASGLHLVDLATVDPWAASSAGTGELIAAAVSAGASQILLGVGGSGCTDGGLGAVAAIEGSGGLRGARLTVLCDVTTPYELAARVYGPQKGADPTMVERLTDRLNTTAGTWRRDPRGRLRTGAAGGLAGALWATYDAQLVSGVDYILDCLDFDGRLGQADAVLTGEGRLDSQTAEGKVVDGVVRLAKAAGVPTYAVVGRNDANPDLLSAIGLADVVEAGDPSSLRRAAAKITAGVAGSTPTHLSEGTGEPATAQPPPLV